MLSPHLRYWGEPTIVVSCEMLLLLGCVVFSVVCGVQVQCVVCIVFSVWCVHCAVWCVVCGVCSLYHIYIPGAGAAWPAPGPARPQPPHLSRPSILGLWAGGQGTAGPRRAHNSIYISDVISDITLAMVGSVLGSEQ